MVSSEFVRTNPSHLGYVEYARALNDHLIDETLTGDEPPIWCSDHGQVLECSPCMHADQHITDGCYD